MTCCTLTDPFLHCLQLQRLFVKTRRRSAGSMRYPAIKENSLRHFPNGLLSDGRSCLPCRVHGYGSGEGQSSTLDARRSVRRRPWLVHSGTDNFSGSTLQLFHMRTVKAMIIGNSEVGKTSLRGQVRIIDWLFFPRLALILYSTSSATS